jgi:hypothetical protein
VDGLIAAHLCESYEFVRKVAPPREIALLTVPIGTAKMEIPIYFVGIARLSLNDSVKAKS